MLNRFHPIPERYGRTDIRTDGQTDRRHRPMDRRAKFLNQYRASVCWVLTRDKNDLDACCHKHTSIIAMVAVCLQHYSTREDSLMHCGTASPSATINGVRCVINSTVEDCWWHSTIIDSKAKYWFKIAILVPVMEVSVGILPWDEVSLKITPGHSPLTACVNFH